MLLSSKKMFGRENETLGRVAQMMMHPDPYPAAMVGGGGGGGGDEEFPRRDERVPHWSQQETIDFIRIRGELEKDFTVAKRNKTLWQVVADRMKERGYRKTADQCKSKWKNLVNRYKGKETSDPNNGRQCPFFEELHAVFTERAKSMQRQLLGSESVSGQSKKRAKRVGRDQYSDEFSEAEAEDEDDYESEDERVTRSGNPQKSRKFERDKRLRTSAATEKPSRLYYMAGNDNNSIDGVGNNTTTIQEMLGHFLQQQQLIDMQWRESMEKRAFEKQLFEQEWRQSMEKLERERMMIEQASREREEQRRIREESRAEKRDALLTTLLNKLIHENHL